MTTTILFQDDFSTNGVLDSEKWDFNRYQSQNNPSYLGQTQMRQMLPLAENGMARIRLDTYLDGQSFYGSEAITKQAFSLPGNGGGIAFEGSFKFEGTQGGMITGFFSLEDFPPGLNNAIHDEIDYEILTTQLAKISTNVFAHSADNINPLSFAVTADSFAQFHTYRMEWFSDHTSWFLDGTLIRTESDHVPTQPQQLHLNLWGVPGSWGHNPGDPDGPTVGDPNFVPAKTASANQTYYFDVSSVKVMQLSAPSSGSTPTPPSPSDLVVHGDGYVTTAGHALSAAFAASVLSNDSSSSSMHASLVTGPAHGTLQMADNGTFTYTPNSGFAGIDSFVYQTTDDAGAIGSSTALISVAPVKVGATTTLDFGSLSAGEQVATMYNAFLGRGADFAGFVYWFGQQLVDGPQKGALASIKDIANSFAASNEAKAIYPLLVDPKAVSDAQVGAFVDTVYHNLFGRAVDAGGQSYWAGQVKQAAAAGQPIGSLVVTIVNGAQGSDIVALLNKAHVNLEYVNQQFALHTTWSSTGHDAAAALVAAVTADPHTALLGIKQAGDLVLADLL